MWKDFILSLCKLCQSNIFGVRAVFGMEACHVLPQCVLAIFPLIRGVIGDQTLLCMLNGVSSLLCGFHSLLRGRISFPVFGVEALYLVLSCDVRQVGLEHSHGEISHCIFIPRRCLPGCPFCDIACHPDCVPTKYTVVGAPLIPTSMW